MAHKRRTHRRKSHRRSRQNLVGQSVETVKATSRRYMPKVKTGLENVGSKVITTTKKSVPFLQKLTQKLFSSFTGKTRRNNRK